MSYSNLGRTYRQAIAFARSGRVDLPVRVAAEHAHTEFYEFADYLRRLAFANQEDLLLLANVYEILGNNIEALLNERAIKIYNVPYDYQQDPVEFISWVAENYDCYGSLNSFNPSLNPFHIALSKDYIFNISELTFGLITPP